MKNNKLGRTVSWNSADTKVATVDTDGRVTAVGSGTTTVTAIINGSII
ncbi:MAG: Ig-like domain-containing protein [Lachnospiraceae bacterium]|nr:Ig-like domain-containing protein [Lachnospiraceae bacterium]